ncbi:MULTISPECIES: GSU2403 family nucleotidyltransferase fold protein [unclassified Neorhizobium]|uniref:nucleotidyltransferase family protein n=1 Tax=unclassified Neorhizobium TaxID=2629175 RepID=UPI001FF2E444|nr:MULTISPECIES: GSU2403 family nucleotidyltransferase fold protein [unclassified Neorhizobium]MCJ9673045.1 GSU2403 family nucleotidyltransferase fold protein [Neorhizobium sp. SHOUNA12B]MCJ9748555.1 GSU2403 family nucleotidyltransferase fold protein [Neorhizobium sp. SHOUNA12A]
MKSIDLMYQTMLAELAQRAMDAAWTADFPAEGRFITSEVKGKRYWYFDMPDGVGGKKRRYVGPADDEEIAQRVNDFKRDKDSLRDRRRMVASLTRQGGMIAPDAMSGDIVEALSAAGLFRLRGVLIGTVAFQTYPGILGVRLPVAAMLTGDADIAQDYAISQEVEDTLPPIVDLLQAVDPSFRPVPYRSGCAASSAFQTASGYRVEFLTSNRGNDDYIDQPSRMPALGGTSTDPLRFLDYLIRDPMRTVLLHKNGVPVTVPAPERYAVHKLIVASTRRADGQGPLKRDEDIRQSALLIEALAQTRRHSDLALAYTEARDRGIAWQEGITAGAALFSEAEKESLMDALRIGGQQIGEQVTMPFSRK